MKILAVSDEESPALWDHYVPGRLDEYDLIISCGDLKASYLTFLATMSHARVLYVHGNHDGGYLSSPPEGCDCIDGQLVVYNGVRILGLGGCRRYCPGEHQYSESQMRRRIARLRYALWRSGGVDIVVTHTSPRGLGDMEDPAHRGFESFVELVDRYRPSLLLHGHTHLRYQPGVSRELTRGSTGIINVSERYTLELSAASPPPSERDRLIWKTRHRDIGDSRNYFSL